MRGGHLSIFLVLGSGFGLLEGHQLRAAVGRRSQREATVRKRASACAREREEVLPCPHARTRARAKQLSELRVCALVRDDTIRQRYHQFRAI